MSRPLQEVQDSFNDATHLELDVLVTDAANKEDISTPLGRADYISLLCYIVEHSHGVLDHEYLNRAKAMELLKADQNLKGMLDLAWEHKSYRKIRNLPVLRLQEAQLVVPSTRSFDLHQRLSKVFQTKYFGVAVEGFHEYLTQCGKLFRTTIDDPRYYARFCSIVQSSGTGKSRMMIEMRKKGVIVIYMSLRDKQDENSFPSRDPIPSQILTNFRLTHTQYRASCYAFFVALFNTLKTYLHPSGMTMKTKESVLQWVDQMCAMSDLPTNSTRAGFFKEVLEGHKEIYSTFMKSLQETTRKTAVDEVVNMVEKISLIETPYYDKELSIAYDGMAESILKIFDGDSKTSDQPRVMIAVDEAHALTQQYGQGEEAYRPADVICRVINAYSHHENHAVWVVFASTTSKVADFSPPNQIHNSDRVAQKGEKLFPPYTQLGWDQFASGLGEIEVPDVSRLGHIASYGRPLWMSLKTALDSPEEILDFASSKLCGGRSFDAGNTKHVLAVLGQRFCLEVTFGHPDSVQHLESGVASHLLVCLGTTIDRSWRFTKYPSEPLLSCAAACQLHTGFERPETALKTLLKAVNSGMIDMGQRGELASRFIWLLAKDLFVREQKAVHAQKETTPSSWDDHLMDCEMIPVVDWLDFIFGTNAWGDDIARKAFKPAYLNFSHWVCMETNIGGSKVEEALALNDWTLRHWQRTSAVQCCHTQPLVDKVIPIYFTDKLEGKLDVKNTSHIFISDKARQSKSPSSALLDIDRKHGNLGGKKGGESSLPYIAILADLALQSEGLKAGFYEEKGHPCLRIHAFGVNAATYPFLKDRSALMMALQELVYLPQFPGTEMHYRELLNAQVKFGATIAAKHMSWERGKRATDDS